MGDDLLVVLLLGRVTLEVSLLAVSSDTSGGGDGVGLEDAVALVVSDVFDHILDALRTLPPAGGKEGMKSWFNNLCRTQTKIQQDTRPVGYIDTHLYSPVTEWPALPCCSCSASSPSKSRISSGRAAARAARPRRTSSWNTS